MNYVSNIKGIIKKINDLSVRTVKIQESLGRIEARQIKGLSLPSFKDKEFQVHSQWGEDGLIQYLINEIEIPRKVFIEFGVEDYIESNTRYLLINNNWSGLVIDGSRSNINFIKNDPIYWKYNIKAECQFITKENINQIFIDNGIEGQIGLLSVDIDGNDYWIWDSINVVSPAIVIAEYNARFGPDVAVTVPYDPSFVRSKAHYSMVYYGASLRALCLLGDRKGYALVGCNTAGNNAFFVRKDLMEYPVVERTVKESFVKNQFREARNQCGELAFLSEEEEARILEQLPLINVECSNKDDS